jgi:hypothetical protein
MADLDILSPLNTRMWSLECHLSVYMHVCLISARMEWILFIFSIQGFILPRFVPSDLTV